MTVDAFEEVAVPTLLDESLLFTCADVDIGRNDGQIVPAGRPR